MMGILASGLFGEFGKKKYPGLVERGHMSYLLCTLMRICTRLCMNTCTVRVLGACARARERLKRDARADFSTSICWTSVADFGG